MRNNDLQAIYRAVDAAGIIGIHAIDILPQVRSGFLLCDVLDGLNALMARGRVVRWKSHFMTVRSVVREREFILQHPASGYLEFPSVPIRGIANCTY